MIDSPPARELKLLIRSQFPLIFIDTLEEERAEKLLVSVARMMGTTIFLWSTTSGMMLQDSQTPDPETTEAAKALRKVASMHAGLFIMRDLGPHLTDPVVCRLLRDIGRDGDKTLVIVGEMPGLPESLRTLAATYRLPRPDVQLIEAHVRTVIRQLGERGRLVNQLDDEQLTKLVMSLRGLTLEDVDRILNRLAAEDGVLSVEDIASATKSKGDMLARGGAVELVTPDLGFDWVAGFTDMKQWARTRYAAFTPEAEKFGLSAPKGVLLTGVPGCGKSFVIKALAKEWNMPLLRLDAGSLFDKFMGETERNLRSAFETAEALAPSILWIDEIEKGFASTGPSDADGGLAYRLVGTLATWMQERKEPVFMAATSNDITLLPPELTRQGRFDEIFFVDLPELDERTHLFAIQLSRRNRDYRNFDCTALAQASVGFSGAEIEQSVVNAMYAAFAAKVEITDVHIAAELAKTKPLTVTAPDRVAKIREWGEHHARMA